MLVFLVIGSPHWTINLFQVTLMFNIARYVLIPQGTWVPGARRRFFLSSAIGVLSAAGLCLTIATPPPQ